MRFQFLQSSLSFKGRSAGAFITLQRILYGERNVPKSARGHVFPRRQNAQQKNSNKSAFAVHELWCFSHLQLAMVCGSRRSAPDQAYSHSGGPSDRFSCSSSRAVRGREASSAARVPAVSRTRSRRSGRHTKYKFSLNINFCRILSRLAHNCVYDVAQHRDKLLLNFSSFFYPLATNDNNAVLVVRVVAAGVRCPACGSRHRGQSERRDR